MRNRRKVNGYRPFYVALNGKRRPVRLHDLGLPKVEVDEVRSRLMELAARRAAGLAISGRLAEWVAGVDGKLRRRIEKAIPGLELPQVDKTLAAHVTEFFERPTERKQSTIAAIRTTATKLVGFFGPGKQLRSITSGEAMDFRAKLVAGGLARATVSKMVMRARQLFRDAFRRKLIDSNPFAEVIAGTQRNPARLHFVKRETIDRVLAVIDDLNLKRAIVLARYGGLRIPSELIEFRWSDIDFSVNQFRLHSPKTAGCGKSERCVPIFPELRPYLVRQNTDGEFVVDLKRWPAFNLRKAFHCAIQRAGVERWPKLFQNLRSTRETELVGEGNPVHVVCAWIGNSPKVANDHYLQVTADAADRYLPVEGKGVRSDVTGGAPGGALDRVISAIVGDDDLDGGKPDSSNFFGKLAEIRDWLWELWNKSQNPNWAVQGSNL